MYVECAEFSTLFKKLDTSNIQNYKNSLNNSVCSMSIIFNIFSKVVGICEILSILRKIAYLERAKLWKNLWVIMFVECTKFLTFWKNCMSNMLYFEGTWNVQNYANFLSNNVHWMSRILNIFWKLITSKMLHFEHYLKIAYFKHTNLCKFFE